MHGGSCLCGTIRHTVEGPLRPAIVCHCRRCRMTSGQYVVATSALRERARIAGESRWPKSCACARRGFRPDCGSGLVGDGPGRAMSIHAGSLDDPYGPNIAGQFYCADKGDYFEIVDGHPQATGPDPDLATMAP